MAQVLEYLLCKQLKEVKPWSQENQNQPKTKQQTPKGKQVQIFHLHLWATSAQGASSSSTKLWDLNSGPQGQERHQIQQARFFFETGSQYVA
jgi:hypothetical protein